jgi:hypothetical protein
LSPERLARLKAGDESVIQEHLNDFGDPDYVDNLGHICQNGGYPDEDGDPQYGVEHVEIGPTAAMVTVKAYFDEKYFGSGCPDMPSRAERIGEATFAVRLSDGAIEWRQEDLR